MKKLVGFTMIVMFMSFTINAQPGQRNFRNNMNLTPEQQATLKTERMTLNLDLNEKQQKEVYALMLQNANNRQNFMAQRQQNSQSGVPLSSNEKFEIEKQRLDNQIENKAAMKNILNKEQFEKWEKIMELNNSQRNSNKFASKNGTGKNSKSRPQQNCIYN